MTSASKSHEQSLGDAAVQPPDRFGYVQDHEKEKHTCQNGQQQSWRGMENVIEPRYVAELDVGVPRQQPCRGTADQSDRHDDARECCCKVRDAQRQH